MVRAVPKQVLDPKAQIILDDFGRYFREFPEVTKACTDEFQVWFAGFAHPKLSEEQQAFYKAMLTKCREDISPQLETGLMDKLVAADAAAKLSEMLIKYQDGEEIDLLPSMRAVVEQFELDTNRKVKTPWVQADIGDLLTDDENDRGFKFRMQRLNDCIRPLRPGDAVVIAARPDKGKTSSVTDLASFMAPQLDEVFPGENRTIGWFNNEGPGIRIIQRLYQSALNATRNELVAKKEAHGVAAVREEYEKATGGKDRIRVYDVHDFWNHEVEDIIRANKFGIVIFDMVDNIKFGGAAGNNGQRTDQLLEAMYQWARIIGVKHDCVVIMLSQISADGENMAYPTLSMLKDSKTGKQGAADLILTIGALDDFPNTRYFGATKNKLQREKMPKSPKVEATFDSDRGRYNDPQDLTGAV